MSYRFRPFSRLKYDGVVLQRFVSYHGNDYWTDSQSWLEAFTAQIVIKKGKEWKTPPTPR
jgi:hypothetical protein